jgi:hypothetical protein
MLPVLRRQHAADSNDESSQSHGEQGRFMAVATITTTQKDRASAETERSPQRGCSQVEIVLLFNKLLAHEFGRLLSLRRKRSSHFVAPWTLKIEKKRNLRHEQNTTFDG